MRDVKLYFRESDKVNFLKKHGFVAKLEKVGMTFPCYHDDVDYADVEVYVIYRNGEKVRYSHGYNWAREDDLDSCFESLLRERILGL